MTRFQIYINNRDYSSWEFKNVHNEDVVDTTIHPFLEEVNPLKSKLFSRDILSFDENNKMKVEHSILKSIDVIAGVLVLDGNKTFGRTDNNKRLLYQCIPDDKYLPTFLIPYDMKLGFSKKNTNKYVVFKYDNWDDKHPKGKLLNVLGDVSNLEVFYEYQLYSKSLHVSLTQFTNTTRKVLNKVPHSEYVSQILKNETFKITDRRDKKVITIDPPNSTDFDDGLGIEPVYNDENIQIGWSVSVYIANVFLWMETLDLWNTFSHRVSTIYLPDRKRPMLPTILSDTLCSLQEKQDRFAFAMHIPLTLTGDIDDTREITYENVLINVFKNYHYEENELLYNERLYSNLFDISYRMDNRINNSHDIVSHWMVLMNGITGIKMIDSKIGIFRSVICTNESKMSLDKYNLKEETKRVIVNWNNISGHYIHYSDDANINHQLLGINNRKYMSRRVKNKDILPYVHVTSPIRRLVDLLNQIIIYKHHGLVECISDGASSFLNDWINRLDYVNTSMRSIKKLQNDCTLLYNCITMPKYLDATHNGVVFDKVRRNNGSFNYTVYLEELNIISRLTTHVELTEFTVNKFRLYMFDSEYNVKRKIKLQLIQ